MASIDGNGAGTGRGRLGRWLLGLLLLLGAATLARAEDCSQYPNGTLDGATGTVAPSQLYIDRTCTIRNYPASNPFRTNISFSTQPGQTDQRWLVIFDNVVHTGQMACNAVAGHKIWFTNGSSTSIQDGCQNLLIPVEKIDKDNPQGQATAAIGVPFTYRLTMPVLFDPGTETVIDFAGSPNDLHGVTLTDDLGATGADLAYVGHVVYWEDTGEPVPHTFSDVGGLLTFDNFPIIPAGRQVVIELTVVLEDTPQNVPGRQFVNTAKWDFGRLIDDVFYQPLPGEWGITDPMTIAAPQPVVTKSGPATMNLGTWGQFTIDVRNDGLSDLWNATLLDRLPDGPAGGMCSIAPQVLGARVFAADGVTPVAGKGPLAAGTDFVASFTGAPGCTLSLRMLTAAGTVGPGERLIVTYRTQLDPDTPDGIALTNVAGVVEWFNGDESVAGRQASTRTLTDGTVGTDDHEDAHTVTVALSGLFFEKTVANLTTGAAIALTAAPGDRLRYTLRLRTTDAALTGARIYDELDALNPVPAFAPGTLSLVSVPGGADGSSTSATGGSRGTGVVDIRGLDQPAASEAVVVFDVTLAQGLANGYVVANQSATRLADGSTAALSDDPNVNGVANPLVAGDEDPTRVVIEVPAPPPAALTKENTQATASIGEVFTYRITVPSQPYPFPIYDVQILDDLSASAADLRFVGVTRVSGSQPWTPVNTGTATSLVIEDPANGIDIPAGEQVVVEVAVQLLNTATNTIGLQFTNSASYLYGRLDANPADRRPGGAGTTPPMTIVGPESLTLEKGGSVQMDPGTPGTFRLEVHNPSLATAYAVVLTDRLPDTAVGGMCDVAPTQVTAQLFQSDGVTPVGPPLVAGSDFTVGFAAAPECTLTISVTSTAGAIGPDERLVVTYQAELDADSQRSVALVNVAGATSWASADPDDPATGGQAVVYARTLTDGTPGILDHEDDHVVLVGLPQLRFDKTVANVTTGVDPASEARPGDTLRYTLRVENLSSFGLSGFALRDELDRLNPTPLFVPGSLVLVTFPGGADTSATDPAGGGAGTGLLEVRNLTLGPSGGTLTVVFEARLAPVIANGTTASDQAQFTLGGIALALSDDPNVNGVADPDVADDEDPTRVTIVSAPRFVVQKVSTDLSDDPAVLLAGETLRYTITVRNTGTDHGTDVLLRDQVPVNTTYVAGTTTLNGSPVADAGGMSPLVNGMPINAPADPTPGSLPVDTSGDASYVATVTFDVVVDADVVDGTVISNQGFVSAAAGGVSDQPSDDPRTPIADDPTRDVVGNLPLLYAEKRVALQGDFGSPGTVDPGDVLRYTITVWNTGTVNAADVVLQDGVPADTTYVADSTLLDGAPLGRPDGGNPPLASGIALGELAPGGSAVVQFDLRVNDGTPAGTIISNQAVVSGTGITDLLTDGDGNPATGPEPTVVVVGDAQLLAISKEVAVVGGGPALPGAELEYLVRVVNVATVPAVGVVITDDLDAATPGRLTYVAGSATMNGSTAGVSVAGSAITAGYSAVNGPLQPGESVLLRFRAVIAAGLAAGTTVTNTAVAAWNVPAQTASASVSVAIGGLPGVGTLNGTAWHDADFDDALGIGERRLAAWSVELYLDDRLVHTALTDTDGAYRISGLEPNDVGTGRYELRFRAPGAGPQTALLGMADSPFVNGLQRISEIVVSSGANLQDLNLPIDPNGVVYDSMARGPVPGVSLTLLGAGSLSPLPASCFDDPGQQGQVTLADGYYKFDVNFADPACPSGGAYVIGVTVPGTAYVAGYSQIIPPASGPATVPFNVPACPGGADDAVPATVAYCEVQPGETAPSPAVPARSTGTIYHVHLTLDGSQRPGTSQLFNNHIPIDRELSGAVAISKTTPLVNVTRGQLVPYTITVNNVAGLTLTDVVIVDRFPAGFTYVEGSARLDGVPAEPSVAGRELAWSGLSIAGSAQQTLQLLLAVGAGVSEGEYVNRAQVQHAVTGNAISGEATATVRVVPDPTFDCTDVTGKVFDDLNRNGVQDDGERGLPGVRLVTARGLAATTDPHGRYHITCAATPDEARGSNVVLKLDDRTLPSGFRPVGDQVQVKRATRGKALRLNFGASVHRVVGLDLADAVFEPGTTEMRPQWRPRLGLLLEELRKAPAVLRLSYLADVEDAALVDRRVEAVKDEISRTWEELDCCYALAIEPEVFWRLGAPPRQPGVRATEAR